MNRTRAQLVDSALFYDALAAQASAHATLARTELKRQAREEYDREGAAPTWRTPAGTVSLAISQPTYVVEDERAFVAWVALNMPSEVEEITRVRPAFASQLLKSLAKGGDVPVSGDQMVPGLRYVEGGAPRSVSILAAANAKADATALATAALAGLTKPQAGAS